MKLDESIETRLFIDGEFTQGKSSTVLEIKNPATEEVIAKIPEASLDDIDKAVKAAKRAFPRWYLHTYGRERGECLYRLADLVDKNAHVFAKLETLNMGKPCKQAEGDMEVVARCIRYYAGWSDKIQGKEIPVNPKNSLCYTRREPVGVVAMIVPWNYPLMLLALKIAPALACGCTCVLKTSEKSPLTGLKFGHLIKEAGFPHGVVNIICGNGPSVGEPLAMHELVDKISFTGSTATGKHLAKHAGETLKRISLELGGKSPLLVLNDADIKKAAVSSLEGLFTSNTGQCCVACSRILVQANVYDEFLKTLKSEVEKTLCMCSPQDGKCNIGPIVDEKQYKRVCNYVDIGKKEGATVYHGGVYGQGKGYFVQPTIFADVTDDMTICKEEIFGPVIVVQKFNTVDEGVRRANETPYGLGAGVFTRDIGMAHQIICRLKAGNVHINTYNNTEVNTPFGGCKQSGIGREWGEEGLEPYLEVKAVFTRVDIPEGTFNE